MILHNLILGNWYESNISRSIWFFKTVTTITFLTQLDWGYENSDNYDQDEDEEIIEAKLSLWIVNDSKVVLAQIEFDNGYQHVFDSDCPQLKIFQDAYIGKTWYLEEMFY